MKITVNTCYSHILYIMTAGPLFGEAVQDMKILKGPGFQHEGMAGYIETEVEFNIKSLKTFANLWDAWYTLSDTQRINLYGLAKGLGDRK